MSNPVVHFEITGKDGKQLQEFYGNLFGWRIDANNPMNKGRVATEDGGIGGGIAADNWSGVVVYVAVPDLAATLERAVALGGRVIQEITEIPGMVTYAQFTDPAGNRFGIVKG
jgi:predicted enzyme related to lactoylglutathione lyase